MTKTRKIEAAVWKILVNLAALLTMVVLLFIVIYILVKGIPNLSPGLFSLHYTTDNQSIVPALIHTIELTLMGLLFAVPLGIFAAVFMNEYAKRGSRLVALVGVTSETLTGIPSIVYGLFGMLFFVEACHLRKTLISGALTIAIMILPTILRTTQEALMAVPDMYREASFGLGAGKLRTVFKVILPSAMPGILSGIILAIGRIVGESAALIYTAGTIADKYAGPLDSGRTLAVHMYLLSSEGLYTNQAYATAVVLLVLVLLLNFGSKAVANRITRERK
ncbi:MAG: phosphate ABC transporter permease PstA [Lachnospiraceae bacterium]